MIVWLVPSLGIFYADPENYWQAAGIRTRLILGYA